MLTTSKAKKGTSCLEFEYALLYISNKVAFSVYPISLDKVKEDKQLTRRSLPFSRSPQHGLLPAEHLVCRQIQINERQPKLVPSLLHPPVLSYDTLATTVFPQQLLPVTLTPP
ncbi:hypothetical protein T4A_3060 [Trichinella pseudospiralis]|uniref:Uncharacterized protein n=1 Tax=Trichinella pseudospiralis TaxID=6337 RepID=A0A0V1F0W6_TRIPS|nr:hypothetical protein T4A_3060 [Trichinella pseudospiralis]